VRYEWRWVYLFQGHVWVCYENANDWKNEVCIYAITNLPICTIFGFFSYTRIKYLIIPQ